jgi:cysteine desulfurase
VWPPGHSFMKSIYLDNAAATPIDQRVERAMTASYKKYGNPSSYNNVGRLARADMESARASIASFLGARPDEIIFTSSGSEANNLALFGALGLKKGTVLTTAIEHPSVLEPIKKIKQKVTYIEINKEGLVNLDSFARSLSSECLLVSVMYANNEIGTIQPVRQIAKRIKEYNAKHGTQILFHVDACQAAGYLDMNVQRLGADLVTFNGSKVYGPRGIGVLYVHRGVKLSSLISGGSQERGLRAGTENVPAIVGLAKALAIIKPADAKKAAAVRDYAIAQLEKHIPEGLINGPRGTGRLANNISFCVPDLTSENLLLELDKQGISAGSGSACTSHSVEPSHVLKAIGVPVGHINGALRFSLGRDTAKKDIDSVVQCLVKVVADLKKRYAPRQQK